MTDQEVISAIRRRLSGIEGELLVPPHATADQLRWAMNEVAEELARTYGANVPPPVNVDVPAVMVGGAVSATAAVGEILTCTMGNWTGEPSLYSHKWKGKKGAAIVDLVAGSDTYVVQSKDAGQDIFCTVTASNAGGSTLAPPSNTVSVPATARSTRS